MFAVTIIPVFFNILGAVCGFKIGQRLSAIVVNELNQRPHPRY